MNETLGVSPIVWVGFALFIVVLLILDLGILRRRPREITPREAFLACIAWISLGLIVNAAIYVHYGAQRGIEFLTGYLIEYSLSVDNIFVFLVIFLYFGVPPAYQHRVLFYGVLGAIVMRGVLILLGTQLVERFHWMTAVFGVILVLSALKFLTQTEDKLDPERNWVVRLFRRYVPLIPEFRQEFFFVKENGRTFATLLCLVLVSVEITDLIFAVDSVPAIFGVTSDPFIIFTSNICAILGLRSLYFMLSVAIRKLVYLRIGLSMVLLFIGVKMIGESYFKISTEVSLLVIVALIGGSVLFSFIAPGKKKKAVEEGEAGADKKVSPLD